MSAQVAGPAVRRPLARVAPTALAWRGAAIGGTASAGVLHLLTAAQHASSGDLVVGFFLVTAAAQLGAAACLATGRTTPSPRLLVLAVVGTSGLLLLYLIAHSSTLLTDLGVVAAGHDTTGGHGGAHDAEAGGHAQTQTGPVAMGGEAPASPEPATLLGTATVVTEVLALGGLSALLPARWRALTVDVVAACGATVWLLWFVGVLS